MKYFKQIHLAAKEMNDYCKMEKFPSFYIVWWLSFLIGTTYDIILMKVKKWVG